MRFGRQNCHRNDVRWSIFSDGLSGGEGSEVPLEQTLKGSILSGLCKCTPPHISHPGLLIPLTFVLVLLCCHASSLLFFAPSVEQVLHTGTLEWSVWYDHKSFVFALHATWKMPIFTKRMLSQISHSAFFPFLCQSLNWVPWFP